jgi:hypothetical protein
VEEQEQELGPTATVAVTFSSAASSSSLKNKRQLQGGSSSYSSDTSSMSFMPYYGPWLDPVSNSNMLIPSSLKIIAEAAQHIIHCIHITVFQIGGYCTRHTVFYAFYF